MWAPWRAEYFLNEKPKNCIFCSASSQRNDGGETITDEQSYVIHRDRTCFVILNAFPYTGGHLMVTPYRHTANINDLTEDELKDLMVVARRAQGWLQNAFNPHGFNLGLNLGSAAGAGIVDHLHWHVVPRWNGDTNFMTVIGDKRVISEGLRETFVKLKQVMSS